MWWVSFLLILQTEGATFIKRDYGTGASYEFCMKKDGGGVHKFGGGSIYQQISLSETF